MTWTWKERYGEKLRSADKAAVARSQPLGALVGELVVCDRTRPCPIARELESEHRKRPVGLCSCSSSASDGRLDALKMRLDVAQQRALDNLPRAQLRPARERHRSSLGQASVGHLPKDLNGRRALRQ